MLRFLLFVLFFSSSFADEDELPRSSPEQIAASRRDFLVADRVSPFSGQIILQERDMEVKGAEPLFIDRYFNPYCLHLGIRQEELPRSTNIKQHSDWRIFPHLFLYSSNRATFQIPDASGITYDFKKIGREAPKLWQDSYGICNACGEEVSGKFDVRNTKVTLKDAFTIQVQRPDGTEQIYKAMQGKRFALEREILPNGKVLRYYYSLGEELTVVESQDPLGRFTYARIRIGKGQTTFTSSSQTELKYCFNESVEPKVFTDKKSFSRPILAKVESVFYPSESYLYNEELLLKEVRGKTNSYFCGYALIGRKDIPVGHHHYRVSALRFDGEDQEACYLQYKLPEAGKSAGETIVTQKDGLKVVYGISPLLLPSYIQWWDKNELKKEKKFNWSTHQWLDSVVVTDGRRNIYERKFRYDSYGNPIEELFIDYVANENYQVKREFSQDGRQLLLREETEEGKVVTFAYAPNTNLVAAKRTFDRETLLVEELRDYDDCYNLIKTTLRGKGEQHRITRYTLRQQDPFLHMPEWVEELFVENGKELPLTKVHLHYDGWGNVKKEEWFDANGQLSYEIERSYNARGDLLTETDPMGQQATYLYDERGRSIQSVSFSHRLITNNKYDGKGRLISIQKVGDDHVERSHHYRYDANDHLIERQDPFGHSTFYTYDAVTRKASSSDFPASNIQTFSTYDCLGREIEQIDGNGHKTTIAYNCHDLPLTICHPDGEQEQFSYTKTGKLKTATDEEGKITSYTYDVLGRVTSKKAGLAEERWVYDAFDLIAYFDKEGNETTYFYDGAGRKIKEIAGPKTSLFSYDFLGRLAEVCLNDTLIRTFKRDPKGQVLEEVETLLDGTLLSKQVYSYDGDGNCTSKTTFVDGKPATETFLFDSFGRLIGGKDPLGYLTIHQYDDKFLNEQGQMALRKTTVDPRSVETVELFDPSNRLVKKEIISSDEVYFSYSYGYDACDNLLFRKNDLSGVTHTFSYTNRNWLDRLVRAATTPNARTTSYTYTTTGKRASKIESDGIVLSYRYDDNGFLEKLSSSDGTINHHFTYNNLGDLLLAKDCVSAVSVQRQVDRFGNILSETFPDGRVVLMSYDPFDQLTSIDFGEGRVSYTYDARYLRKVGRYDKNGNLLYVHSYDLYDLSGHLLEETLLSNIGKTAHQYDLCGRRSAYQSPHFTEHLIFDAVGNVKEKKGNANTSHYRYDALSQLVQEDDVLFNYDNHYNRSRKCSEKALFNHLDELISHGGLDCSYDLRGNPVRRGGFNFTYDALDRLTEANNESGTVRFVYDPLGRAYSRTFFLNGEKLSEEHYLYQGKEEMGAFSKGKLQQLKVLGLHHLPVAIELENQLFAPVIDSQRNVVALLDPTTQEPASTYTYTAFGEEANLAHSNPWRFSSKRYDPFLNLINYGHRFYDPAIGRWFTPDPAGFVDGYNLYLYLHNNPYRYFDPDGRFAFALPLFTLIFGAAEVSAAIFTIAQVCEAAIFATAIVYGTKYIAQKTETEPNEPATIQAPPVSEIDYVPTDPTTGEKLPLPKDRHGRPIAEVGVPHTQIGWREGTHGDYKQTREWGANGQPIKRTDWSDHGSPHIHSKPHDHFNLPNPTGGTPQIGKATPIII